MNTTTEAKQVIEEARKNHWTFRVMDKTGEIHSPVRIGDWVYEPANASIIPGDARKRIEQILKSGHNPTQIIMGHQLTKVPELPKPKIPNIAPLIPKLRELATSPETKRTIEVGGQVIVEVVKATAVVAGLLGYGMIMALAAVDPSVIVVLEDGSWIEVMSWYDGLDK
jgi:hypothetical protein